MIKQSKRKKRQSDTERTFSENAAKIRNQMKMEVLAMQSNYGGVLGSNKARGKFEHIPKPKKKKTQESSRNKRKIRN